ncbi:hypothetical protein CPC08DRAFT_766248 [Agrocybe pediades]|nr:hypothetical protein CPC08DRAFT_766248 [Agrocybe pediades]
MILLLYNLCLTLHILDSYLLHLPGLLANIPLLHRFHIHRPTGGLSTTPFQLRPCIPHSLILGCILLQFSGSYPAQYPGHVGFLPPGYPSAVVQGEPVKDEVSLHEAEKSEKKGKKRKAKKEPSPMDSDSTASNGDTDSDEFDWPQGDHVREVLAGTESRTWNQMKWQFRSHGTANYRGIAGVEVCVCLGLLRCGSCSRPLRPKTDPNARRNQLDSGCALCGKRAMYQETCNARTYNWKTLRDDGVYKVWEHSGVHEHDRVPDGPVTAQERKQVDKQVGRNISASAHKLRTGDGAPGSVPLAQISPKLANPRVARYEITQSKLRQGISAVNASSGSISFLKSISSFQEELSERFILHSRMYDPTFIMLQSAFMKEMLTGSVTAWNDERGEGVHRARHGLITDGDHSFFKEGVLLTTVVFNSVMAAWVPVLYTWILKQDTSHHRPHFKEISQTIVQFIQQNGFAFETKYLLHVFDFSNAQRAAHAEEYADAVISITPSFHTLTAESQKIEREKYLKDTEKAELGCNFHFSESAERLKKNSSLIPPEQIGVFDHYLRVLLYAKTTREEFDEVVQKLQKEFPRVKSWISWWLRPTIASMIFPVCSVVDPKDSSQVPKTSNPVEHSHSLLHHATGTDYDLITGMRKLKLHIDELEAQYKAIKDGHFNPPAPRDSRPKTKKQFDENDGRAPDTVEMLHPKGIQDQKTVNDNIYQSYIWQSPNSCFFDNGMELWYRAYVLWSEEDKKTFQKGAQPKESYLAKFISHCEQRLKHSHKPTSTAQAVKELTKMQKLTRECIFKKWKLYKTASAYGCAMTWLSWAVKDGDAKHATQSYFGFSHTVYWKCSRGHDIHLDAAENPSTFFNFNQDDIRMVKTLTGRQYLPLDDYFQHYIPRISGGNYSNGTTPVHKLPLRKCTHPSCSEHMKPFDISTSWPATKEYHG